VAKLSKLVLLCSAAWPLLSATAFAQDPVTVSAVASAIAAAAEAAQKVQQLMASGSNKNFDQINAKLDDVLKNQEIIIDNEKSILTQIGLIPRQVNIIDYTHLVDGDEASFEQTFGATCMHGSADDARAQIGLVQQHIDTLMSYGYDTYPTVLAGTLLIYRINKCRKPAGTDVTNRVVASVIKTMQSWISTDNDTYPPDNLPTLPALDIQWKKDYAAIVVSAQGQPRYGCVGNCHSSSSFAMGGGVNREFSHSCTTWGVNVAAVIPMTKDGNWGQPEMGFTSTPSVEVSYISACPRYTDLPNSFWRYGKPSREAIDTIPTLGQVLSIYVPIQQQATANAALRTADESEVASIQNSIAVLKSLH